MSSQAIGSRWDLSAVYAIEQPEYSDSEEEEEAAGEAGGPGGGGGSGGGGGAVPK